MRLSDFIMLNEEQKKITVLHKGVLIGKRTHPGSIIFLFQLNHFYVETFGDLKTKGITQYRVFVNTNLLHPYLESIGIDDVFGR